MTRLEARLADLWERADQAASQEGDKALTAYAQGIYDALVLVRDLAGPLPAQSPLKDCPPPGPERPRLHQMSPADVTGLDLAPWGLEDLTEAAFTFENLLMDLLEDDNVLPFDLYAGLSRDQLTGIILKSTEKICRLSKG